MASYSPEQVPRPNLIQKWRVARQIGKVSEVFNVLNEASNPAPQPKVSRVSIRTVQHH